MNDPGYDAAAGHSERTAGGLPPSRHDALIDVPGLRVGHSARVGDGYLTGTTVILAPEGGMVAGVDVRGGGPGSRETDLLAPTQTVERVHAIVFTGGSAYGLAAASGVADELGENGIGLPVGPAAGEVVPIVPAAVLFDLGRGGEFSARPDAGFGRAAVREGWRADIAGMAANGNIGAGTGVIAGGLKGGIGNASMELSDGTVVAALVVVNAVGSTVDPVTGGFYGERLLTEDERRGLPSPDEAQRDALRGVLAGAMSAGAAHAERRDDADSAAGAAREIPAAGHTVRHTTLCVVATDAALTKAQCTRLAAVGHDGMARAIEPVHTLFDGDIAFGAATGTRPAPTLTLLQEILVAAPTMVGRAIVRAMLAADGVTTPAGHWPAYRDMVRRDR